MMIFIPRKIREKQLIHFAGQNCGCHKTHRFKPKLVLQVEQTTYIVFKTKILNLKRE